MGDGWQITIGLGVAGLAPWGAVSTVQAATATASNREVTVTATGDDVLAVQSVGTDFDVIVSGGIAPVTVTLTARSGATLVKPSSGSSSQQPHTYTLKFPDISGEDEISGTVTKVALEDIKVEIKAENGTGDPPKYICADGSTKFTAVVTPALSGTYSWSRTSTNIPLENTSNRTVTVNAGPDASASIDAEELKVVFTPNGIQNEFVAEHELTVTRMKLHGVNGAGFALDDNPELEPNRVWLGTWLDLAPKGTPLVSNLFDWSVLEEYRGGVILSTQEFSWKLTNKYDDDGDVSAGSKGPMYFVDRFAVDRQGQLVVPGEKDNGVFQAVSDGTHQGFGMHMSLLSVETYSLTDGFGVPPDSLRHPFWYYNGVITVTFKARLYPAGAIDNPTVGFSDPARLAENKFDPFYPESAHKYWSETLPSWADKEPIACMEQIFVITWGGDGGDGLPSCQPILPDGPNRAGNQEWEE